MNPHYSDAIVAATPQRSSGARITQGSPDSLAASRSKSVGKLLSAAAALWFSVTVIGQLLFAAYVAGFYGRAAIQGQFETWNRVLPHGYVAGETIGNLMVAGHLALSVLITLGGALQLLPAVRRVAPAFHRWNGRVYLLSVVLISVSGMIMTWTRGTVGDLSQHVSININGLLILICAAMALRHALARRFDLHRRWAMRLFLVVSGVWFFRIGLSLWLMINQGPVGFDPDTFSGPFLTILAFSQYLVPLAVVELYFRAQESASTPARIAMSLGLIALALLTASGVLAASMILWLPRL